MDPLARHRDAELTLPALVAAARELLDQVARRQSDERVSAFPDERTLRWYRSLGLLDAPLRHRGRDGLYGYRHVLQAVAVKLLQGEGHTLAQVRKSLAGEPTAGLEARVAAALGLPPPPVPRSLVTTELAPGVLVTVDPHVVSDPVALLARLARSLQGA